IRDLIVTGVQTCALPIWRGWLAVELFACAGDRARLERSEILARAAGLPRIAAGDVHMHVRARRALQDTLTAIRVKKPLAECGFRSEERRVGKEGRPRRWT